MEWLAGWKNRIKLTIDQTKIDTEDLIWFPVTVFLSSIHGDCVFDELTSDANCLKIAFTKDDGITELYGEIEKWDDANEIAIIHVSKDGWIISNTMNTDFYMYFDKDHIDNIDYIGAINTIAGIAARTAVWDNSFKLVTHMVDRFGIKNTVSGVTLSVIRSSCGIAVISDKVYIAGGYLQDGTFSNVFEEYDSTQDTISTKTAMPAARNKPFSGTVGGKIYVIGGCNEVTHIGRNQVWEYNPSTNDWTIKSSTLPVKAGYGIAVVYNNKIYCIGGIDVVTALNDMQIYTPATDSWVAGADIPDGYANADCNAAILTVDGKDYIYLLCGIGASGYDGRLIRYDIENNSWSTGYASYPISYGAGAGGEMQNKFVVMGGWNWTLSLSTDRIFWYDPIGNVWDEQPKLAQTSESTLYLGVVSDALAIYTGFQESFSNKIYKITISKITSLIEDSTSNNNDGIKKNANEPIETAGKVGLGQDFDGINDYINCGNIVVTTVPITLETIIRPDDADTGVLEAIIGKVHWGGGGANNGEYGISVGGKRFFVRFANASTYKDITADADISLGTTYYVVVTRDVNGLMTMYINGIAQSTTQTLTGSIDFNDNFYIGAACGYLTSHLLDGLVDESRLSNICRTAGWIKAIHNSLWDALLTYGSEEEILSISSIYSLQTNVFVVLSKGKIEEGASTYSLSNLIIGTLSKGKISETSSICHLTSLINGELLKGKIKSGSSIYDLMTLVSGVLTKGKVESASSVFNLETSISGLLYNKFLTSSLYSLQTNIIGILNKGKEKQATTSYQLTTNIIGEFSKGKIGLVSFIHSLSTLITGEISKGKIEAGSSIYSLMTSIIGELNKGKVGIASININITSNVSGALARGEIEQAISSYQLSTNIIGLLSKGKIKTTFSTYSIITSIIGILSKGKIEETTSNYQLNTDINGTLDKGKIELTSSTYILGTSIIGELFKEAFAKETSQIIILNTNILGLLSRGKIEEASQNINLFNNIEGNISKGKIEEDSETIFIYTNIEGILAREAREASTTYELVSEILGQLSKGKIEEASNQFIMVTDIIGAIASGKVKIASGIIEIETNINGILRKFFFSQATLNIIRNESELDIIENESELDIVRNESKLEIVR